MSIPPEILADRRPPNTIVQDSGKDSYLRYSVRCRVGRKQIDNGKSYPVNGKVIGHIINNVFIPLPKKINLRVISPYHMVLLRLFIN